MILEDVVLGTVYKDTLTGGIGTVIGKYQARSGVDLVDIQPLTKDNTVPPRFWAEVTDLVACS